jgi:hypothetical protein
LAIYYLAIFLLSTYLSGKFKYKSYFRSHIEIEKRRVTMTLLVSDIHYIGPVFSPFSGLAAGNADGSEADDSTLLFVYYEESKQFDYISDRVLGAVTNAEVLDLNEVIEKLDFDGGLILRVHTDWHGINCYGFAPAESVIFL